MYNLEVNFLTQDGNMIAKLRGIIDTIGEDFCIVDVNGVGASMRWLLQVRIRNLAT